MKAKDKIKLLVSSTKSSVDKLRQQSMVQHPSMLVDSIFKKTHESSPLFVLSTGRTGTQLLTNLFALSEDVMAHHEPEPNLNYYSKLAWQGGKSDTFFEGIFEGARYELIRDSFILSKQYVETNNRITFLAPYILKLYPRAKFVHLVRKPESFVKSGLSRDWYANVNIHDEGRIVKKEGWNEFDEVEKLSWLWAETNRWIYDFGKALPKNQFMVLKSEDLYSSVSKIEVLLAFCKVKSVSKKLIEKTIRQPINESAKKVENLNKAQLEKISAVTANTSKLIYEG